MSEVRAPSIKSRSNVNNEVKELNPNAPVWEGSTVPNVVPNVSNDAHVGTKLNDIIHAVDVALNMPKPEMTTFSGNPLEYWSFTNQFEATVASRPIDDKAKLMYLIQFCSGTAKSSIENYIFLNAKEGYAKAKQILSEQFGQSYIVTTAHMKRVLNRTPLRPNDGEALWDLARDMRKCEIVLSQMGYSADLNSSDNLLHIQQLLPIHLQSEWAKQAHGLMKMHKHSPVKFRSSEYFNISYKSNFIVFQTATDSQSISG